MSKNEHAKPTTIIEQMAKQISHLEVQNVNSSVLQQFSLFSPYMILSETCSEKMISITYTSFLLPIRHSSSMTVNSKNI